MKNFDERIIAIAALLFCSVLAIFVYIANQKEPKPPKDEKISRCEDGRVWYSIDNGYSWYSPDPWPKC